MPTKITITRVNRGKVPRYKKQQARSKSYVAGINSRLAGQPEIIRRNGLTARQHNILGFIPTLYRMKIPPNESNQHSQENPLVAKGNHTIQQPMTAQRHKWYMGGVRNGGYARKDPLFHSGMRQLTYGYNRKETPSAFSPIKVNSGDPRYYNSTPSQKGASRRAKRGLLW